MGYSQADSPRNLERDKDLKILVDTLHKQITNLWLNYPDSGMKVARKSLMLSKKLTDSVLISKSIRLIAGIYYFRGDYEISSDYNNQALEIAHAINDSSLINNAYNNLGLIYIELGNYHLALEYLLRAKDIKQKIGENYGLARTLNNIGLVFSHGGDYDAARAYFQEAYEVAKNTDKNDQIYALNNIGTTHLEEGQPEDAFSHFSQGLKLSLDLDNTNWGAVSLRRMGEVFMIKGELDSASVYLKKSLVQCQRIDDKKGIAEVYFLMSQLALRKNNIDESLTFLDQSHEKAKQLRLRQQLLDNLIQYSNISSASGVKEKQIEYLNAYISLRDSLFIDVVERNLTLVPLKLKEETDRFRLAQQQAEIKSQALTNKLSIFIIIIIVPLLITMIVLLNKNDKKNKELEYNNEELHRTQKLLITSEKMASLGVLAAGVSHEINNPLNFIKNGIGALSKKIDVERDEELKSYFKIINEGVDRATNIVKSLSHFSRRGPSVNEKCNTNDIIENCLLILHNTIRNKIKVKTNFTKQSAQVKGNEGRLHQAFMNIIANATQAIKEEGTIEITTKRVKGKMEISIEDDGEGIPEENLMKISDPFFTTKSPGEGTGLGLFITFSIIEEHNGSIEVKSTRGEGTKFIIKLPTSR